MSHAHRTRPPARRLRDVLPRLAWFELRAVLVTVLACAVVLAAHPATPGASAAPPKVVIVVGPVGSVTNAYRADGDSAARAARAAGATVEKVYTPDATWPRVRDALQGASLVVYLGHGNGWPSRYRSSPWPRTQNGMGLNPQAGVDDSAHQYFGEAYLARDVRLAPHAVVLLVHLCYASGNSEPGLPEGSLDTAKQRVDNYAAGWLAAGAEAVIAEGHGGPAYYVRRILAGDASVESIWRQGPTAHDNVLAFPSVRTPGMTALMDPNRKTAGFYRSLVGRARLQADEVARGAAQVDRGGRPRALAPVRPGLAVKAVALDGMPVAGSSMRIRLKLDKADRARAGGVGLGARWDPIAPDPPLLVPDDAETPAPDGTVEPAARAAPIAPPARAMPIAPLASAAPIAPDAAATAPPIELITAEIPGEVVSLGDVKVAKAGLVAELATPRTPGLYRLVVTLHDADGVAFDAAVQERIPAFTVRVTGELSAAISAVDRLEAAAGAPVALPVAVANTGLLAWVGDDPWQPGAGGRQTPVPGEWYPVLAGRWLRLRGTGADPAAGDGRITITPGPGDTEEVVLALVAPSDPGSYLLLLDVVSPRFGSLTAAGGAPAVVRVEVVVAADEAPGQGGRAGS